VFSDGYRAQLLQKFKRCFTVREVAAGEFAHHERMHDNFMAAETLAEFRQVVAKVAYCAKSSVIVYHGALDSSKMWAAGRIDLARKSMENGTLAV
jgi:hypothetical protein